ncbi:hypothetical protein J5N97_020828 [Dioscorea zingiberensis]|uniref:HhH-GPD domain-containing protein n=1 Tax=Dioscorea zingiberensis TaxID=325984 RepID=A0A9D5CHB6_9LILI|nr:hypothetical protein J5N97_020828 [Dioscorea zingiberensis]
MDFSEEFLPLPSKRRGDLGGAVGPGTPAKEGPGRRAGIAGNGGHGVRGFPGGHGVQGGLDLNVGMFRPFLSGTQCGWVQQQPQPQQQLTQMHGGNQLLLNGRFFLNHGGRMGSSIHPSNGVSVPSSACNLNFLPDIGGIVNESMGPPQWRPVPVDRCRRIIPPDQRIIDLTDEADAGNSNEEIVAAQHRVEDHAGSCLSGLQSVVSIENRGVPSEPGDGEAVVLRSEVADWQQLVGEKQVEIVEEQVIDLNKTPQQKPRRKKHRPKVIREGKPARKPRTATPKAVTAKPAANKETPTGKRKYVRRKKVSNPSDTPSEIVGECVEPGNGLGVASVRRSLNFTSEGPTEQCTGSAPMSVFTTQSSESQARSVGGMNNFSGLNNRSPALHAGMNSQIGMPFDLNQSTSQIPTWPENPEITTPNSQFHGRGVTSTTRVRGELRGNPEIPTTPLQPSRNKMIRENLNNLASSTDFRIRNNLKSSLSDLLMEVARKEHASISDAQMLMRSNLMNACKINQIRKFHEMSRQVPEFIDANKKSRLEEQNELASKASSVSSSSVRCTPSRSWNLNNVVQTSPSSFTFADAQCLMAIEKMQASEAVVASPLTEGNKSIIPNLSCKAHSLSPISSTTNYHLLNAPGEPIGNGNLNCQPPVTPDKPSLKNNSGQEGGVRKPRGRPRRGNTAANSNAKTKTRKTRKEKVPASSICANANGIYMLEHQAGPQSHGSLNKKPVQERTPLGAEANQENHPHPLNISFIQDCQSSSDFQEPIHSNITSQATMTYQDPIDFIVQKLKHMTINRVPEAVTADAQNALVPYNGGGTMVPYKGPYDAAKRRRPRPKVDLDLETNRVWRLLLIKDSIDGDNELDGNKEKWWAEERRVFRGRVDSFIARMHLVQGDRRFSPWKGSVVDSVVGVFLTQNVSDHLSSSAFMSLAAKFPLKPNNKPNVEKEGASFKPEECISSSKDIFKLQELQGKEFPGSNYIVIHEADDIEEQQIVDSQNSFGTHLQSGDDSVGYTKDEGIYLHGGEVEVSHPSPDSRIGSPFTVSPSISSSEVEFRSSPEDAASSQKSVISSQNSSEYPAQTVDHVGTCLESNPESEKSAIENMYNFLDGYTSFTNLLKMAENTRFHKFYSFSNGGMSSTECGTVFNQLASSETEKGTTIQDLLDNPNGACSPMVMANNSDNACHDFMGVTSKSSTSYHYNSSSTSISEVSETAYGVREKRNHFPSFASMNRMANNITDRECMTTAGDKSDVPAKPELPETIPVLGAYAPVQKKALHQLDGSARESCLGKQICCDSQLPMGRAEALLDRSTSINKQQINEETSALGEIAQPISEVQTRNSTEYQSPKSSADNPKQATQNLGAIKSNSNANVSITEKAPAVTTVDGSKRKRARPEVEKKKNFDWDSLRKQVCCDGVQTERSSNRMDSLDWEAVRNADVHEISDTIRERGMNNMLAERIKDFLNRLVRDHGSVDLEWLRDVPPDKAKEYLLSIRGLGLKSVECVRLLTLHHLAFPVDTNVGRISVRLGWVPLQPLPESLQLHLLELYPVLETIQKYLWPRLCTLDQRTLYELHYQLITFGKVFCTKSKPNCNACPMRGECKHFASAFASARLALPGPEDKSIVSSVTPIATENNQNQGFNPVPLPRLEGSQGGTVVKNCEPIIEEPATPEPEFAETLVSESAIEDIFDEDPDEIPMIKLNLEEFTQNLQNFMQENNLDLQEGDMSKALVALAPEAASIPMPKLKNVSRLRTEHQVYELPDSHPLLEGLDRREPDDPCSYLLAIWTPGETSQSNEPPEICCNSQETGKLCDRITCFSCNSVREAQSQIVRGTLLIPCRTAMRGSFPLNGTYFQVNEVFADHASSHNPINVPREWIWNLPRRTVYFGTSIPSIFRGLSTEGIQHCFWRGFVCVRGFDQATRAPRPLSGRLHFPASKIIRNKKNGSTKE